VKVVLDTNVLLSALATRGLCEAVLEVCLANHEIVLSEYIFKELRRNLKSRLRLPAAQVDEIIVFFREKATMVNPAKVSADACRDQTDLAVLGTASVADADCLVTGDDDLLELKRFAGVAILSPREFHDRLR